MWNFAVHAGHAVAVLLETAMTLACGSHEMHTAFWRRNLLENDPLGDREDKCITLRLLLLKQVMEVTLNR
jgi:hypothetical protein